MQTRNPILSDLTPTEKLRLVEDLWDDLAADADNVPVHDWQKEALDGRQANFHAHPATGVTWESILQRIRERQGS